MINLRPYQVQMIDDLAYEYKNNIRCICMVGPCGCGKTVLVAWMAAATALRKRRVLFLVHRQELIDQSSETFTDMNISHGIIATKQPKQYERMVQIGSVQTVVRRLNEMPAPDYIIIDECHHVLASTYRKILDHYPHAQVLGVTATPERMGGQGLGDVFNSMTIGPSVKDLIEWGNLAPFDLYAPPVKFDASQLRVKFGDYVREDLQLAMDDNTIIGDLIESYHKYAEGLKAIVYCVSLQHSEHVARSFRNAGIPAQHIDGETPKPLREQIIKDFRSGRVQILCNVDLISEGFDVPSAGAVILARPTQSLTLYIQQAMRAMRPDENNPDKRAIIIDHVGNVFRHGMPDEERDWSLESKKKKKNINADYQVQIKVCPQCYQVHRPATACPYCGFVYPVNTRDEMPKTKAGELAKVESIEAIERKEKRMEVGRARTIKELENIAIKRGYSMRWVTRMAGLKGINKYAARARNSE